MPVGRPALPRLVIGPPSDAQLDALLTSPADWPETRTAVGAIVHPDHNWAEAPADDLRRRFAAMRALGFGFELEVGAVKPWSKEGRRTFEIEAPWWRRFIELGAPLVSLAMDEPWGSGRALDIPDADTIEQTADFVALVHEHFPALSIGDIEPYPALPLADHLQWLRRLDMALVRRGARSPDFYRLDPNWNAFGHYGGSWAEVLVLQRECCAAGLAFSLIYWAASLPQQQAEGTASRESWSRDVLRQAAEFRAAGGDPDQIVVQSWLGQPDAALPETDPISFAGSVLGVLREL
jgi:hypothetical protein